MNYKYILLFAILLTVETAVPLFAKSKTNDKFNEIIKIANDSCQIKYGIKVFSEKDIHYYKSNLGELIQAFVEIRSPDSIRNYSFYAVKKRNWDKWKIRLEILSNKMPTENEWDKITLVQNRK